MTTLHASGGAPTFRIPRSDVGRGTTDQELVSRFQAQSLGNKTTHPSVGTRGNSVSLCANLFEIRFPKGIVLYDYAPAEKELRHRIVDLSLESKELAPYAQGIAHDGTLRLIAMGQLKNVSATVRPEMGGNTHAVTLNGHSEKHGWSSSFEYAEGTA